MRILCDGSSCPHETKYFFRDRDGKLWAFCELHLGRGISERLHGLIELSREEFIVESVMKP